MSLLLQSLLSSLLLKSMTTSAAYVPVTAVARLRLNVRRN